MANTAEPRDRYYTVLGIVCLLGISSLLPWNVLITQAEYLIVRAHQEPTQSWLADQIVSLTANSYLFFNLGAFLLLLPFGKHISIHAQIMEPLCMAVAVVLLQAWVAYNTSMSGGLVILCTLISTAVLGAATAPLTSATYALASYLPPVYIQVLVLGQSLAGVVTSGLSFLTIWSQPSGTGTPTPKDVRSAAVFYFLACATTVVLGCAGYWALPHIKFVQYWTLREAKAQPIAEQGDPCEALLAVEHIQLNVQEVISKMVNSSRAAETRRILRRPSSQVLQSTDEALNISELTKQLRGYHWIVGIAFAVSLAAFPGIVACICSVKNPATSSPCHSHPASGRFYGDLFQPFVFLLFNAGDSIGRAVAGFHRQPCPPATLFIYGGMRIVLVAAIALCNVVPSKAWIIPHLLWSDLWPAFIVALLGFTNGHLATITLMHAPRLVSQHYRDRTGVIMSGCLTLGLTVGSFLSVGIMSALQHQKGGQ